MKKNYLFGLLSLFTVLFVASCQEEDVFGGASDANSDVVTFNVTTEQVGTRAVATGEGALATRLYYGVYEYVKNDAWALVPTISMTDSAVHLPAGGGVVNIRLAKQKKYSVIFWAQSEAENKLCTVDWKNRELDINNALANQESYDAFWGYDEVTLTGALKREKLLVRPFAQLNIGVSEDDYNAAIAARVELDSSAVIVKKVPTTMSLVDGTVGDFTDASSVAYTFAAIPSSTDWTFPVTGNKYLALNYVLVGTAQSLIDVELSYKDKENGSYSSTFTNVPVRRNYRTNIYGNLLTNDADYSVKIEAGIGGSYNPEDMLKDVLTNGGKFTLWSDMTLPEGFEIPADKNIELDLNDNTLTVATTTPVKGNLKISNGNVDIDVEEEGDLLYAFYAYDGATVDLSDANIELADKNAVVVVASSDVTATINVDKTTITGGTGTHGISMPQGAKDIKINITESTLTAEYALYMYATNSVVTIDDKSSVKDFWIMGGKVDIAYTGTKPEVKTDNLAAEVNFYSQNEYPLHAAFAKGGEITLVEDVVLTQPITLAAGVEATLNLNGKTISGNFSKDGDNALIYNSGKLTLTNGTFKNEAVNGAQVIKNSGELTLDDVTIQGAPIGETGYPAYAVTNSGSLTVEDGTVITSDRGAVSMSDDANVTINGGNISVTDALGSRVLTAHVIYAYGKNSTLTINNGTFAMNYQASGDTGASVICPAGATIVVKGGNFSYAGTVGQSGIFQNYMGYGAPVDVYGGTYTDNTVTKSGNLADGYKAIESNGKYVVVPNAVDAYITAQDELANAIKNGATAIVLGEGEYTIPSNSVKDGQTLTIKGTEETVINGQALYMDKAGLAFEGVTIKIGLGYANGSGGDYAGIYSPNATFTKCHFVGGLRVGRSGAKFEECEFTLEASDYVYTYGNSVEFNKCTFNSKGKALIVYSDGNGTGTTPEVKVSNCKFYASQKGYAGAINNQECAAVEIDNFGCGVDLILSGNTIGENFSGQWRIKSYNAGKNNSVIVNGTEYTSLALDGKAMTIDADKNVTIID